MSNDRICCHVNYTQKGTRQDLDDFLAHKLQRSGLLVAKPKFDRDGTDLIALMEVADGAKFCRIQWQALNPTIF